MTVECCGILDCLPWTSQENTHMYYGKPNDAKTLTACQDACINDGRCTGIDWDPNNPRDQLCWFSGPWSGPRNYRAPGVTHYDINKDCVTSGRPLILVYNRHNIVRKPWPFQSE